MNERIKELLEEASEVYDYWHRGDSQRLVDHKMFAELIVRKCADIAQSTGEHGYIASQEMFEYFGVEK